MDKQLNHNGSKSSVNTYRKTHKYIIHIKHFKFGSSNECNTFFNALIPAKLQEL